MVNWYYNYLLHRNLYFGMLGCQKCISTSTGFPQGGVNSADFWKIAFNPALDIINEDDIRGNGFADDLLVLKGGYNLEAAMKKIQKCIDRLVKWGKENGLVFNPDKTVVVIFTRRILNKTPNNLRINNKIIPFSENMRYLGVFIDGKLSCCLLYTSPSPRDS